MKLQSEMVVVDFLLYKVNKTVRRIGIQVIGFCPGVPVHKGITIVLSLFRSHWLAVLYCLVYCIGSCEPVHEDRTGNCLQTRIVISEQSTSRKLPILFSSLEGSFYEVIRQSLYK